MFEVGCVRVVNSHWSRLRSSYQYFCWQLIRPWSLMCYSVVIVDELAIQISLFCMSWPRLSWQWPVDLCDSEWRYCCSKQANSLIAFKASLARAEQTQSVNSSWRISWLASLHWYDDQAKIETELLFHPLLWSPCLEVFSAPIQEWQFNWASDLSLLKFGFGLLACLSAY